MHANALRQEGVYLLLKPVGNNENLEKYLEETLGTNWFSGLDDNVRYKILYAKPEDELKCQHAIINFLKLEHFKKQYEALCKKGFRYFGLKDDWRTTINTLSVTNALQFIKGHSTKPGRMCEAWKMTNNHFNQVINQHILHRLK